MIRHFRLRDVLLVQKLARRSVPLQVERQLTQPYSSWWAALGAPLPWHGSGAATYLFNPKRSQVEQTGFIQAVKRFGRPEADVTLIAPGYVPGQVEDIWLSLLEHVVYQAGEHGIQRLYIYVETAIPYYDVIVKSTFTPYIRETLFCLPQPPAYRSLTVTSANVRPQREADGFDLQRLANRYAPAVVRKAEGIYTNNGDPPTPLILRTWWQPEHIEGFVYEDQGSVIASAQLQRGHSGHWLRLLGDPDQPEIMHELLTVCTHALSHYKSRPIYCALRPYQNSVGSTLTQFDFTPLREMTRFVKHTTSFIKHFAPENITEAIDGSIPGLIPTDMALLPPRQDSSHTRG